MQNSLTSTSLLQLLRLASPSLPVGAYSYSHGMEYACEAHWIGDRESVQDWVSGILQNGMAKLDIPLLARIYQAWDEDDSEQALQWSRYLLACRDTSELRNEDSQTGYALARLLRDLDVKHAALCMDSESSTLALGFSLAASTWNIPLSETAHAYLWSWLENQVAAAVKLIPIGQTDGQRILSNSIMVIEECVAFGLQLEDDAIFGSLPGLALASALHENQYSRLFQS